MISSTGTMIAIESAIAGGSISLFSGEVEIDNWIGSADVSKAEDLLFNIDLLLRKNDIARHKIDMIAVSAGPGSFTGIRIGIATALGLKAGLGIEMASESALNAMVYSAGIDGLITAALPVGRNSICVQTFRVSSEGIDPIDEPYTVTEVSFALMAADESGSTLLVHDRLFETIGISRNVVNYGSNLAGAIGNVCKTKPGVVVEPLFVSKSF